MSDITVNVNGNTLKMTFSLKVFRTLGKVWGLKSLPEVMQKVALIELVENGDFEILDILYDLLFQAIDCHPENRNKITKDDLENLAIDQLMKLSESMSKGILEAFPVAEVPEKKVKAPKK